MAPILKNGLSKEMWGIQKILEGAVKSFYLLGILTGFKRQAFFCREGLMGPYWILYVFNLKILNHLEPQGKGGAIQSTNKIYVANCFGRVQSNNNLDNSNDLTYLFIDFCAAFPGKLDSDWYTTMLYTVRI